MSTTVSLAGFLLIALALFPRPGPAQETEPVPVPDVEPLSADVESIDGIVTAFYEVISGPKGEPRQWGRDATLYLPNVHFTPTSVEGGKPSARIMPKQEFVDRADRFLVESGFVEEEIHRVTRTFGHIADVASTYRWRTEDGRSGRGINFIHLFHDGDRWWITHATWDSERDDNPIPGEFLPPD
jgi:hypothetical protein